MGFFCFCWNGEIAMEGWVVEDLGGFFDVALIYNLLMLDWILCHGCTGILEVHPRLCSEREG